MTSQNGQIEDLYGVTKLNLVVFDDSIGKHPQSLKVNDWQLNKTIQRMCDYNMMFYIFSFSHSFGGANIYLKFRLISIHGISIYILYINNLLI